MRPIKFRAWDKEKKIMYSFDEIMKVKIEKIPFGDDFYFRETYIPPENRRFPWDPTVILQQWYSSNPWLEIMEYSCIQDKREKEIYDGDILLSYRNTGNYIVRFDELDACFEGYGTDCEFFILEAKDFIKCEIIGNIYEHSHLLSGGQQ